MRVHGHHAGGDAMRRMNIGFDDETFREIDASAETRGIKFAARVRELVELGLETEKEAKKPCSTSRPPMVSSNSVTGRRRSGRRTG